jgi:hypothetical protein
MEATLWLMTILSYWTFAHRLYYTWVETRWMDAPPPVAKTTPKAQAEKSEGQRLQLGHKPI